MPLLIEFRPNAFAVLGAVLDFRINLYRPAGSDGVCGQKLLFDGTPIGVSKDNIVFEIARDTHPNGYYDFRVDSVALIIYMR